MISIRRQLTRELLVTFLALLGGGLAALTWSARDEIIEQFDDALRAKAFALSALTEQEGRSVRLHFPEAFLHDLFFHDFEEEKARDFFELWSKDGEPLVRSDSLHEADLPRKAGSLEHPKIWNFDLPNGRPGRAIGFTFTPKPEMGHRDERVEPQAAVLVVASDRSSLDEALTELLVIGGICGGLLVVSMFGVVPRVLKRGLQPLEQLGEQAARIDADSLAERFSITSLPAELQPICGRLNDLLARLEQSFERERRFSADLAHELRTPLAELRSLAECALKWPETRDAATDHETLAVARQMESIVTNLLALARGEKGRLSCELAPVALAPLAQEVWRPFAERAVARDLRLHFALEPFTVTADATLLRSVLGNLFDNAVDYAPTGSEVGIVTRKDGANVVFAVTNAAGNLQPDDIGKLFERFWRKEAARSGGQHVGLGLSLSRVFATAMGWKLSAALDAQNRITFTLAGPAA